MLIFHCDARANRPAIFPSVSHDGLDAKVVVDYCRFTRDTSFRPILVAKTDRPFRPKSRSATRNVYTHAGRPCSTSKSASYVQHYVTLSRRHCSRRLHTVPVSNRRCTFIVGAHYASTTDAVVFLFMRALFAPTAFRNPTRVCVRKSVFLMHQLVRRRPNRAAEPFVYCAAIRDYAHGFKSPSVFSVFQLHVWNGLDVFGEPTVAITRERLVGKKKRTESDRYGTTRYQICGCCGPGNNTESMKNKNGV